jgi:hypothetical protein
MALTVAGIRGPLEYCASFRAARIAAAISKTRLRPSSTQRSVTVSIFVRHKRTALHPVEARHYARKRHGLDLRQRTYFSAAKVKILSYATKAAAFR